jgi:hypothetical protein
MSSLTKTESKNTVSLLPYLDLFPPLTKLSGHSHGTVGIPLLDNGILSPGATPSRRIRRPCTALAFVVTLLALAIVKQLLWL